MKLQIYRGMGKGNDFNWTMFFKEPKLATFADPDSQYNKTAKMAQSLYENQLKTQTKWMIYLQCEHIYKNGNDREGRKTPKNKIGKTMIKPCLVTLPSPRLWCGEPTTFRYPRGPKTNRTIPMWGVGPN